MVSRRTSIPNLGTRKYRPLQLAVQCLCISDGHCRPEMLSEEEEIVLSQDRQEKAKTAKGRRTQGSSSKGRRRSGLQRQAQLEACTGW